MSSARFGHRLAAALAAAALIVVVLPSTGAAASGGGSYNGLALTPPMGYNDWSYYQCSENQNVMLQQARALVRPDAKKDSVQRVKCPFRIKVSPP